MNDFSRFRIAVCYNNPFGGAGRAIYEQVRRLSDRHLVQLFTLTEPGVGFWGLDDLGPQRPIIYRGFPPIPRPFGRFHSLTSLVELWRLNRAYRVVANVINGNFDLALVYQCPYTSAPLLLRHLTIPSVLWTHEPLRSLHEPSIQRPTTRNRMLGRFSEALDQWDPLRCLRDQVYRQVDRANARCATLVVTNSYYSREVLYRVYGINALVNYMGVNTQLFCPLPVEKRHVILSLGHVSPLKGHDFVIKAIGRLPLKIRPQLVVAGALSQEGERLYLEKLASEKDVEITFESASNDQETVEYYNRAKVMAFAPILEPFGLAPLESMACGVPVVGVKEGGVRETIRDGEVGYIVDRDVQAFAEKLAILLTDHALRERLGQQGRDYVIREWSWESSIQQLEEHILQVAQHG